MLAFHQRSFSSTSIPALLSLAVLAGSQLATAQSRVVSWGYWVVDSSYNEGPFLEVDAGGRHNVGFLTGGTIVAWGLNTDDRSEVPALPPGQTYTLVTAGSNHSLAFLSSGTIVAWGSNWDGQCDVPSLPQGSAYMDIAAGGGHCIARLTDGSMVSWGYDNHGQSNLPDLPRATSASKPRRVCTPATPSTEPAPDPPPPATGTAAAASTLPRTAS